MAKLETALDWSANSTAQLQALVAEIERELDRRAFEHGLRKELAKFKRKTENP